MNVKHANFKDSVAAFTLIELIIAVAISGIVLASVSVLFFSALRLRERATEAAEQTLPVDRAVAVMKKDLMGIVPPGVLAGAMGTDAGAIGMSQAPMLEIFTDTGAVGDDAPWGDLQKIDYSLQAPTNRGNYIGQDLVRGITRNLLAANPAAPEPQSLLHDVQNLKFSYYDGTNWNDTWSTTQSNIPVAIRVSLDFAQAQGAQYKPAVQFLVPVVSWSSTNSITNQINN
jgi:type II secretion system protein J